MAQLSIQAGATSVSILAFIQNSTSTTGAGLTAVAPAGGSLLTGTIAYYSFTGANAGSVSIALAVLATTGTAWTTAGIVTIDDTHMPGWVRIDLPNAVLASGKGRSVAIHIQGGTNMAPCPIIIELTGWDNQNATTGGMSALPNAAAGAAGGLWILGANAAATTTLTGVAAAGASPATAALSLTGGAASTTGGGTSASGLTALGGAGAASTNGAAIGVVFQGGGTNTVASTASGLKLVGTSTGHGLDAESGTGATGDGIRAASNATAGNGITGTHSGSAVFDFNATTTPLTLAKTTNITGFNDIAATAIVSAGAITTSGGAVSTVTTVTNQLTAAQIATGIFQDTTAGDFTVSGSIGKSLFTSGNAPGAASGLALVGSNMGTVSTVTGNVNGSVNSVTTQVTANVTDWLGVAPNALNAGRVDSITNIRSNTCQSGSTSTTVKLDASASATNNLYQDAICFITGGTGIGQSRSITSYVGATQVATIFPPWTTTPDNTSTFTLVPFGQVDVGNWVNGLVPAPNVTGIPIADIGYTLGTASAGAAGYMGLDWGHITAATTTVNLSGTSISAVSGAVGSVTGNVGGNVVGSVGSINGVTFPSNFGSLGITAGGKISEVVLTDTLTTYTGNTPQTGDSFARIGSTGSGLTSLAPASTALSTAQWTNALATSLGFFGGMLVGGNSSVYTAAALVNGPGGSGSDPWATVLPGSYTAGQAGNIVGNSLPVSNVTISLAQAVPTSNTANTIGDCLNSARAQGFGSWNISGTTLTLYAPDGITPVRTFTLNSSTAPTSRV